MTPDEIWAGVHYFNKLGQDGEAALLAAGLGLEKYLDIRMDAADKEAEIGGTPRTIEGPLYVAGAPVRCAELRQPDARRLIGTVGAAVIGGTSLSGGRGGVFSTVIGVLIVMVLNNGMIILGLPTFIQQGVLGAAIIAAVLVNAPVRSFVVVK